MQLFILFSKSDHFLFCWSKIIVGILLRRSDRGDVPNMMKSYILANTLVTIYIFDKLINLK